MESLKFFLKKREREFTFLFWDYKKLSPPPPAFQFGLDMGPVYTYKDLLGSTLGPTRPALLNIKV